MVGGVLSTGGFADWRLVMADPRSLGGGGGNVDICFVANGLGIGDGWNAS